MEIKDSKILVVDDEEDIVDILSIILSKEGAMISKASNGLEAIESAKKNIPHLILLDKMMPVMNGIEACLELRKITQLSKTKIVFLSAMGDIDSQIEGLDVGADDYMTKPISTGLLLSKVKSMLRNVNEAKASNENAIIIDINQIVINRKEYNVKKDNKIINFPKKEFELLFLLMSKADEVCFRDEILEKVWGKDIIIGDRTIDVHIRKLREKLGDHHFQTIKGIGYKFVKQ